MIRNRIRIRFRKEGDLRLISHRDLLRLFERLFRRAELKLGMSEGFHPKARISFPSALALGIAGVDEVMEVELAEAAQAEDLKRHLAAHAPPGLAIVEVAVLGEGARKAQVASMTYEVAVPAARRAEAEQAVGRLLAAPSCNVAREGRDEPIDVRADLADAELVGGVLRFTLRASRTAAARPGEVLDALGLHDLLESGQFLTRSAVEIAT